MSSEARWRTWRAVGPGQTILVATAAVLAVAAVAMLTVRGITQTSNALAFGVLIAIGEIARMRLPGDREFAPVATAGGLAYALLLGMGERPATHGAFQVIAVTAAGILIGAAAHAAAGRSPHLDDMARRLVMVSVIAVSFRPLAGLLHPAYEDRWLAAGLLLAAVLVAGFLEAMVATVMRWRGVGARFRTILSDEIRVRAPLGIAIGASALLVTMAAHVMGWTALAVCMAPLVVTQVAYRRYSGIRSTYLQTIRALSRVPEVGGYVDLGHSRRVSRLALQLGRDLGLAESRLLQLEYAALMHDIGQLSLSRPNPAGATVHVSRMEQRRIAELGAEVIRETGVLDRVAYIVAHQADPCKPLQPDGDAGTAGTEPVNADPDVPPPLESRIVRVANAYDDLTGGVANKARTEAVLEGIAHAEEGEYDPDVVRALSRVVA